MWSRAHALPYTSRAVLYDLYVININLYDLNDSRAVIWEGAGLSWEGLAVLLVAPDHSAGCRVSAHSPLN